jgi:regulatory protein
MEGTIEEARETALRHLERRRRTRRELERRLRERCFSPEIIDETLARLERVGLVDDLEYARAFLRDRMSRRAVGVQVMRRQLVERGVGREIVDQALEEMATEDAGSGALASEEERCRKALAKLSQRYQGLEPEVRHRRITSALSRRGFNYGLISRLLTEFDQSEIDQKPRDL